MRGVVAAAAVLLLLAASVQAACPGTPSTLAFARWQATGDQACPGTEAGFNCTGQCAPGYTSLTPITARCDGSTWAVPSGRCFRDPASSSAGSGRSLQQTGTCSGTPLVSANVNNGRPAYPTTCSGAAIGALCVGQCNSGFGNSPPTVNCVANPLSLTGASWNTTASGKCDRICPGSPPSYLLNGVGTWGCANTFVNSFCTATCPYGTAKIQCLGGNWTGSSSLATFTGFCSNTPVCSTPPASLPPNTQQFPTACQNAPPGYSCVYACREGYGAVPNPPTMQCVLNGAGTAADWNFAGITPTRCDRVCGLIPPEVTAAQPNAVWSTCANTFTNSRCTGTCTPPYVGQPSLVCASTGLWDVTSLIGGCIVDSGQEFCSGVPPNSANIINGQPGYPTSCAGTVIGGTCVGQCNSGFGSSPPTVNCVLDASAPTGASWNTTASGLCNRVCVGSPPSSLLTAGSWPSSCSNSPVGSTCQAACPFGIASIKCLNNGTWDTSSFTGQCSNTLVCGAAPTIIPPNTEVVSNACLNQPVGSSCVFSCRPGYGSTPQPPTLQCKAINATYAEWDESTLTPSRCDRVCGAVPPGTLPGATWNCENTQTNTFCTATCPAGTFGAPTLLCAATGLWDLTTLSGDCSASPTCAGTPTASPVSNGHPFTSSCSGTPVGTACAGTCNAGFGGFPPYQVQCVANASSPTGASFAPVAEGICTRVCIGAPPASLLNGTGSWPASCTNGTAYNDLCYATCPNGQATIQCGGDGQWANSTFSGRCSNSPACQGAPTTPVSNLEEWPSSCVSANTGKICYGICKSGFNGDDPPMSICMDVGGTPTWSTPIPSACTSGTTPPARAFLVDTAANEVVICNEATGYSTCVRNNGDAVFSNNPTFIEPIGIEVQGNQVWISEKNPARARVCTWYARQLIECINPAIVVTGPTEAGQIVVTDGEERAFVAITDSDADSNDGGIASCADPQTMTGCSMVYIDFVDNPIGLDIAFGQLWISSEAGIARCPMNATDDYKINNETCVFTAVATMGNGVWVEGNTLYIGDTPDNLLWSCTIGASPGYTVTGCTSTNSGGTFTSRGPAYSGLDVWNSQLYVPLSTTTSPFVLARCNLAATSCNLVSWNLVPTRSSTGTTNIQHSAAPTIPWL